MLRSSINVMWISSFVGVTSSKDNNFYQQFLNKSWCYHTVSIEVLSG